MILPGNLRETTLGDLLGRLHRSHVSGVLELIEERPAVAGRRHRIHLQHGMVTQVETPERVPRLGEVLVRDGVLSESQHRGFLDELSSRPGELAGSVLVGSGMASESSVSRALQEQLRMRVDALFSIDRASVRFHARGATGGRTLAASDFLHGRPRARERSRGGTGCAQPARAELGRVEALERLGLSEGATREDVRQSFRKLAAAVHPDLHRDAEPERREEMQRRFASYSAAYHYLIAH